MKRKHEICDMQILLLAATEQEIRPFIDANTGMDVLIAGVGLPSTMYHLQKRMQQIDYDLIIQPGIAGSFRQEIEPGETFWVKQDTFGDLGTEENGIFSSLFDSGLADKSGFPFTNGWLVNDCEITKKLKLNAVNAVTVNKVSDSKLQEQQIIQQFNPDIESMEGAALHYICLQEDIPFLQIRSVSNFVGERDKSKWMMKEAIGNLNKELFSLVNRLTH
jgi:futalosine hydrolase